MPHNHKEGSHVLPGRFRPMADDYHAASVPFEQAPGHGVSPVELRDGPGPLVCLDCGESLVGQGDEAPGADRAAAAARMVLRPPTQAWPETPGLARRDLFPSLAGLGGELVARHPTGLGTGCHGVGDAVCRLGSQCGLSRVCHSRCLGGAASEYQTCLEARMAAAVAAPAARYPAPLEAGPFSFRKEIANQAQNELKGFVPHRALLPRHALMTQNPFRKADSHDT